MRLALAQLNFTVGAFDDAPLTGLPPRPAPALSVTTLRETSQSDEETVTEESPQARARGATLMALSNKFGYLLLSTGNKSDTLPPYEILDQIMAAYVERDLDIETICQLGLNPAVIIDVVRRIDRSEYKRRQATPGLTTSSKAFGVGRRYPMAADYQALIAGRTLRPEMSQP